MKILDLLSSHLNSEFDNLILNEVHGYSISVKTFVQKFMDNLKKSGFFEEVKTKGEAEGTFVGYGDALNDYEFFSNFDIYISVDNKSSFKRSEARYFPEESAIVKTDSGKYTIVPKIFIIINWNRNDGLENEIARQLTHELTHAYNDYMTFVKSNGNNRLHTSAVGDYNRSIRTAMGDPSKNADKLKKAVSFILYFFERPERNARFAQLQYELENSRIKIINSVTAEKAIKSTTLFSELESLNRVVNTVLSNIDVFVPYFRDILRNGWSAQKITKWLQKQRDEFNTKFMKTASKIAYDISIKNNKPGTIVDVFEPTPTEEYVKEAIKEKQNIDRLKIIRK